MPGSCFRLLGAFTFAICLGIAMGNARAAESDSAGRLFQPSVDPLADVRQALSRAGAGDRLALVVLGANWCHDSRALASRLHRSPLAEVIQQHYEPVFIDVGFYDKGRAVVQQFGVAHYYATPTVLIIDSMSGRLVNDEDRHIWGNAFNIDMPSSVQYFEKWARDDASADPMEDSTRLQALYAQIDRFEKQLAERVAAGYAVVGPMLAAYKAGNAPDEFDARWNELRDFRMRIPGDTRKLREEAQRRVSGGEKDIDLLFPEYPLLSWEAE